MDSLDLNIIQTWILDPDNSTKNRKKQARKKQVPNTNAENIIRDIYNLAGGATCAGRQSTAHRHFGYTRTRLNLTPELIYTTAPKYASPLDLTHLNMTSIPPGSISYNHTYRTNTSYLTLIYTAT